MPTIYHDPVTGDSTPATPHACAVLALSILNHREHTAVNLELAVMALRGATFPDLIAADRQMAGTTDGD